MSEEKNYFSELYQINVNENVEKKNGLSYLSWAWAWAEVKKIHPNAQYKVYEKDDGRIYWDDGKTAWVKTSVTIEGIEHIEYLPVMDYKNKSIPIENITSFDVNKTIQRSLTKACARHGLGLYIYAGEDLPETILTEEEREKAEKEVLNLREDIEKRINILKDFGVAKAEIAKCIKKHFLVKDKPSANYNDIKDVDVLKKVISELNILMKKSEKEKTEEKKEEKGEENK